MTDEHIYQLIERAKQGDQFAYTDLYQATVGLAEHWAKQLSKQKGAVYHDIDEMVMTAMETLPGIVRCYKRTQGKWQTYFRRCFINAMKTLSKRATAKMYPERKDRAGVIPASWLLDYTDSGDDSANPVVCKQLLVEDSIPSGQPECNLAHVIRNLAQEEPVGYRVFVLRHHLIGSSLPMKPPWKKFRLIAAQLRLSVTTVCNAYYRFRRRLLDAFTVAGVDPPQL